MVLAAQTEKSPLGFLGLVVVLSVPLWWVGGNKLPLPVNLPVSALTAFVPVTAASMLAYRQHGAKGVRKLFKRIFDYRRIENKRWYLPTLFLAPFIYGLSYVVMRFTSAPLPAAPVISWLTIPLYAAMYFMSAAGEELGWTAYAADSMQARNGVFKTGFVLGLVWALWHSISFLQTGNNAGWVFWQSVKTVAMRMIIVWLYKKTGQSVFASILYHTTDNISWSLFPNSGSHYNPFITGLLNCIMVILIIIGNRADGGSRETEK